jgi:hypothetical protein
VAGTGPKSEVNPVEPAPSERGLGAGAPAGAGAGGAPTARVGYYEVLSYEEAKELVAGGGLRNTFDVEVNREKVNEARRSVLGVVE